MAVPVVGSNSGSCEIDLRRSILIRVRNGGNVKFILS